MSPISHPQAPPGLLTVPRPAYWILHMEQHMTPVEVADQVVRHLARARRTEAWLSCVTGIPAGTLHDLLTGQRPLTLNELDQIARALGLPTAGLLARDRPPLGAQPTR